MIGDLLMLKKQSKACYLYSNENKPFLNLNF